MAQALNGTCLCGAVGVKVTPRAEQLDACHCTMCRKWAAGPFMALSCGDDVSFSGAENMSVFKSSEWAERTFCKKCGTSIAWRLQEGGEYHVSSQLFAEADNFPFKMQVFIDQKPDNYSFAEATETMTSQEIFAAFAGGDQEANA